MARNEPEGNRPIQEVQTPKNKRWLCPTCRSVLKWTTINGDMMVKECPVCVQPNSNIHITFTIEQCQHFDVAPGLDPQESARIDARANQRPVDPTL